MPRGRLLLAYGLLVPSLSLPPVAVRAAVAHASVHAASPADDQQIGDQITRADAARRDGRLTDAARLYADAYRMTATFEDYRGSDVALDVALQAAAVYREAFKASNQDYTFCRESRDLLLTVAADWEALGRPTPQSVLDELRWAEDRLADAPAIPEPEPEPEPTPTPDPVSSLDIGVEPVLPPPDDDTLATPTEPPPKGLGIALVSGGAAATVAGVVMLAFGAPLGARATRYRTDALASPEFTERGPADQMIIEGHLDAYVTDEQRRGVTLMAVGGAVLGVGLAAVVVGSLRWARAGRPRGESGATSRRVSPRWSVYHGAVALGVSLEF